MNGLPDLTKTEAKGVLLVRGPWDETPGCLSMLTGLSPSHVCGCARSSMYLYVMMY